MSNPNARTSRSFVLALCGCALLALPRAAHAEANASQKAAAESLFDDGVKALKSGHFGEACPKLEESQRIDPGIGTLLYLGECYEKTGRSASAWATFREAASAAQAQGETERARVAATRADRLQPSLSKLTVRVAPESAQLAGLRVTRDASAVSNAVFGIALPVDPGKYRIKASADGYESFETEVELGTSADLKTVTIPPLKPAPLSAAPTTSESTPPSATGSLASSPTQAVPASGSGAPSTRRTVAYVSGALGLVGVGIGSYFGIKAISKNSDAEKHCPDGSRCNDPLGESLTDDAQRAAVTSNIAFGVGAAFAAAGLVLYLTDDSAPESARVRVHPLLGRDLTGFGLGGAFQ